MLRFKHATARPYNIDLCAVDVEFSGPALVLCGHYVFDAEEVFSWWGEGGDCYVDLGACVILAVLWQRRVWSDVITYRSLPKRNPIVGIRIRIRCGTDECDFKPVGADAGESR